MEKQTNKPTDLTEATFEYLMDLASEAPSWAGAPPLFQTKEENGYLVAVKKAGYGVTVRDEGETWFYFTEKGLDLAEDNGIDIRCEIFDPTTYRRNVKWAQEHKNG